MECWLSDAGADLSDRELMHHLVRLLERSGGRAPQEVLALLIRAQESFYLLVPNRIQGCDDESAA
jgi:hypothetical protein